MALSLDGVSVALSKRTVLRRIDVAFQPGRITVILGANGAGKSTLLRTATGLIAPSAGQALIDGTDLATMSPRERAMAIGYLPQEPAVHWNMLARDIVALGRTPHRTSAAEDQAAIAVALAATHTEAFADRPTRELSGGERARVLLARVLAGQPRWLLADEPLASLDPLHQLDTLDMLRATADRGTGVILVLHDLTQAARIADAVVVLKHGAILACGPRDTVLTPDTLAAAYGVRFAIATSENGTPAIIPQARA